MLLVSVLGVVLMATCVQAAVAYLSARAQADDLFDRHMQRVALALSTGALSRNVQPNQQVDDDRHNEDFVVQVWTRDGVQLFQSAAHRRLRPQASPGFSEVRTLDARTFRVYVLITHDEIVQVAQDMAARSDMARTLAWRTVAPGVLLAPLLLLVLWWVVSLSLAPLSRLQADMAQRQVDDLSPLPVDGLPAEMQPVIRELNLLFERVRQAFDVQQHFVADAAHELRSPLTALKLQAQGLQRASDEPARDRAAMRLTAGIDRLTHLVDQLMMLARQESPELSSALAQPCDLNEVALWALADVLPVAQHLGVDLGLHEGQAAPIQGQADTLRVLVRNLLDNGCKYTPSGGVVDLSVRCRGASVCLTVEDSGPGIAPEHHSRVWGRFYRVPGSEAKGSGLGLAIVRAVAKAHGARVQLGRSTRLGGLKVEVFFPLAVKPA
jgi:two-component system OmpR family sensor kinase